MTLWQIPLYGHVGGLMDLWPLYHGAQAWLASGNAYAIDPNLPDLGQLSAVGNAYPIHATLLVGLPLTPMGTQVAGMAFVLVVGAAWVYAIGWARQSWYWLLWLPMWDALRLQQVSAVVGVAAIVALGALQRRSRLPFLLALLALSIKPQQTLVLMLVLAWHGRHWWRSMVVGALAVVVASFLAQPGWIQPWLDQVAIRSDVVEAVWLSLLTIPLAVLLVWRGWRWPGIAVMSSSLGPWPLFGYYVTTAWPMGASRDQAALIVLAGMIAFLGAMLLGFWAFPLILIPALALAALRGRSSDDDMVTPAERP